MQSANKYIIEQAIRQRVASYSLDKMLNSYTALKCLYNIYRTLK